MLKESLKIFYVAELSPSMKESAFKRSLHSSQMFFDRFWMGIPVLYLNMAETSGFVTWCSTNGTKHQSTLLGAPRRPFIPHKCLNILNNIYGVYTRALRYFHRISVTLCSPSKYTQIILYDIIFTVWLQCPLLPLHS